MTGKSKYPWSEWFDSEAEVHLKRGEHFDISLNNMYVQVQRRAAEQPTPFYVVLERPSDEILICPGVKTRHRMSTAPVGTQARRLKLLGDDDLQEKIRESGRIHDGRAAWENAEHLAWESWQEEQLGLSAPKSEVAEEEPQSRPTPPSVLEWIETLRFEPALSTLGDILFDEYRWAISEAQGQECRTRSEFYEFLERDARLQRVRRRGEEWFKGCHLVPEEDAPAAVPVDPLAW